uniref:Uncharacterized protein n=1 Tax=Glossina palpalis gambiensis TaxID=67801 RepID=A0A1B0BRY5_9MUSC
MINESVEINISFESAFITENSILTSAIDINENRVLRCGFLICCMVNENDFEEYGDLEVPNAIALEYLSTVQLKHFSKMHHVMQGNV